MARGELRPGFTKVWGTVSDEVAFELQRFQLEEGLPNRNQTTGAALVQWADARREGVLKAIAHERRAGGVPHHSGVQNRAEATGEKG